MKNFNQLIQHLCCLTVVFLLICMNTSAATRYSVASGNWSATTTWSATSGGASGASAPVAGDVVYIEGNRTVTVNAAALCATLNIAAGSTLTVPAYAITVSGATSVSGTISFTSATGVKALSDITVNAGGVWTETAAAAFTLTGNLTNNGSITTSTGIHTFSGVSKTFSGSNAFVIQTMAFTGTYTNNGNLTVNTLTGAGTFTAGVNSTFTYAGTAAVSITLGATASGNEVVYSAVGAQTVKAGTYNNLTLGGSGTKTTTSVTVNGKLSLEGTAAVSTAPTYGSAASLEYAGSAAQTTGNEFPATFSATGGVFINNANGVTLGAAKTIGSSSSLTIGDVVANSLFNDGGKQLTSTGTLNLVSGKYKVGLTTTATTFPAFATANIASGTTVEYASTAAQTIASAPDYANLLLSGNSTKTANGALDVLEDLTISAGTFAAGNYTHDIGGDFTNNAAFTFTSGSVFNFNGSGNSVIGGTVRNTFYDVTINKSTTSAKVSNSAMGFTCNRNLTVTQGNMELSASGATKFYLVTGDLSVAGTGIFTHNSSYNGGTFPDNYMRVNGNLSISGKYAYAGYTPAIYMDAAGTHFINTDTTSLYKLFLRTGNYYANGPVTVNEEFFAMWDQNGGSFHTNGQNVISNWGFVNSGGDTYVDGGSLTVNGTVQMLIGRASSFNGKLYVSAGTLTVPGLYLGNTTTTTPTGQLSHTGGTINADIIYVGKNCVMTSTAGTLNVGNIQNDVASSSISFGTGTSTLNMSGDFTNNGSFTASANGAISFNGNGNSAITGAVATTFYNLEINKGTTSATVTNGSADKAFSVTNNLTVTQGNLVLAATNTDYTIAKNLAVATNGTLTHSVAWGSTKIAIGGDLDVQGVFNPTVRSHVNMYGTGPHTLRTGNNAASTLSILTLSNGTFTANGTLKANQEVWAMFGTTGSFSTGANNVTFASMINNLGSVNVSTGGTLTVSTSADIGSGAGAGAFNVSGGTVNIGTNLTMNSAGVATFTNAPQINIAGNWINNGSFSAGSSTVTFNGSGLSQVQGTAAANQFYNLEINKSTGSAKLELARNITIANNLNVTAGVYDQLAYTANRATAGGTFTMASGATHRISGTSGGSCTGANYPSNFSTYAINAAATTEYYGGTQTICGTPVYGNLSLITSGVKTAPAGTLTIKGNFTVATATFAHNNGKVLLNGASQTFPGVGFYDLQFAATGTKTLSDSASIRHEMTFDPATSATLALGNKDIALISDASATASVGEIPTTANISYGTGKFIVDRFMPAKKAWRFVATPVKAGVSIFDAWQSSGATTSSTGVQITGPSANPAVNGLDVTSGYSMKSYNSGNNTYNYVDNTRTTDLANDHGYMIYVRGDRTSTLASGTNTTTVLKTKGELIVGTKTYAVPAAGFQSVGNPYASRIDLTKVYTNGGIGGASGVAASVTVWDPQPGSGTWASGIYRTYTRNSAGNFELTPGGTVNNFIESGQAFYVQSVSGGTLTLKENTKSSGSANASRTDGEPDPGSRLRTNLWGPDPDTSNALLDGTLTDLDETYSNGVDNMDIRKTTNTTENISMTVGGKALIVERKKMFTAADTIFYNMSNLKQQTYKLEFVPAQIAPNLQATLEDTYLGTSTPVSVTVPTTVSFTVGSSSVANRFRLVFKTLAPLPVTIVSISASRNNDRNIAVNWKVENELNIEKYTVERSADGVHFNSIATATPVANANSYTKTDAAPLAADNHYRIKAESIGGGIQYSAIVKVAPLKQTASISVYPNPVVDKKVQLQFSNQPRGSHNVEISNKLGQILYSGVVNVTGINFVKTIALSDNTPAGIYQLSVSTENSKKITQQIVIN